MADQDTFKTPSSGTAQDGFKPYVRETQTAPSNNGTMALLVGGLVVAVGFILWFIFGAVMPAGTAPVGGDTTNLTIQPPAAAPDAIAPAAPQPDAAAPATEVEPVAPATPDAADPALVDPAPAD